MFTVDVMAEKRWVVFQYELAHDSTKKYTEIKRNQRFHNKLCDEIIKLNQNKGSHCTVYIKLTITW